MIIWLLFTILLDVVRALFGCAQWMFAFHWLFAFDHNLQDRWIYLAVDSTLLPSKLHLSPFSHFGLWNDHGKKSTVQQIISLLVIEHAQERAS